MQVIFHVGSHKTGTTTIQGCLYEARNELLDHGILYPMAGLASDPTLGRRHSGFLYGSDAQVRDATRGLIAEMGSFEGDRTILSHEAWSKVTNSKLLNVLLRSLEEAGHHDLVAVLVLRNRVNYAVSHYREFTERHRNKRPFPKYLRDMGANFDYLVMLDLMRALFDGRVRVVPYDQTKDIVPEFCTFADIPAGLLVAPKKRENVRVLDALDIEIFRQAHELSLPLSAVRPLLPELRSLPGLAGTPVWTERFDLDFETMSSTLLTRFARLSGWCRDHIHDLFHVPDRAGRPVSEAVEIVRAELLRRFPRQ